MIVDKLLTEGWVPNFGMSAEVLSTVAQASCQEQNNLDIERQNSIVTPWYWFGMVATSASKRAIGDFLLSPMLMLKKSKPTKCSACSPRWLCVRIAVASFRHLKMPILKIPGTDGYR